MPARRYRGWYERLEMMNGQDDFLLERYELAMGRIREIKEETGEKEAWQRFFENMAGFAVSVNDYYEFMVSGDALNADLKGLQKWNECLYGELFPENYESSFLNPSYAVKQLGTEYGPYFSVLAAELRSMIVSAAEGKMEELLIRMELLIEVYGS